MDAVDIISCSAMTDEEIPIVNTFLDRVEETQADLADAKRMLWAMANISHHWWDSITEPRIRSGRFCFRSIDTVLRFDLVNGLPQMTDELRKAIDAQPGSPFHGAARQE